MMKVSQLHLREISVQLSMFVMTNPHLKLRRGSQCQLLSNLMYLLFYVTGTVYIIKHHQGAFYWLVNVQSWDQFAKASRPFALMSKKYILGAGLKKRDQENRTGRRAITSTHNVFAFIYRKRKISGTKNGRAVELLNNSYSYKRFWMFQRGEQQMCFKEF